MKTLHSFSSGETKQLGKEIAELLVNDKGRTVRARTAAVFALRGDLGAGKTTFVQGFFHGLGIKRNPISPTFVIMRRYKTPDRLTNVYHFDAYRLKREEDTEVLEFGKIISDPRNIILVEWPEKIGGALPRGTVRLDFAHGKKENERIIKIL